MTRLERQSIVAQRAVELRRVLAESADEDERHQLLVMILAAIMPREREQIGRAFEALARIDGVDGDEPRML